MATLFGPAASVAVIDTCSILQVQELVPREFRKGVFRAFEERVADGRLMFPLEVFHELDGDISEPRKAQDQAFNWANRCRVQAAALSVPLTRVRAILTRVPDLIDQDDPDEPADPYVLGQALELRDQGLASDVLVVTDDVRPKPRRTALAAACGAFRVPSVTLRLYLSEQGIWAPT